MIDWIDSHGSSWGWQWRHLLEQESTGARSWWPKVIEHEVVEAGRGWEFLLGEALVFHRAFKHIEHRHRILLANHYIDPNPVKAKAAAFGIAQRTWWQRLHRAHLRLSDLMDHPATYAQRAYAQLGQSRA